MKRQSVIFLSHIYREYNPVKQRLINDLSALDYVFLWKLEEHITVGKSITQYIEKGISDCDYFLQIDSKVNSNWTSKELQFAISNQIYIQNPKIIRAIVEGNEAGKNDIGILSLNFNTNYEEAFSFLCDYIEVNETNSLIKFSLDDYSIHKPIFEVTKDIGEKMIDYFSKNPNKLKTIDRRLFEEMTAELFYGFGYEVELTQQTRDGGRDIIAIKQSETTNKYLIECKRPDIGNNIGIRPVRELFGVKQDEKATKAILATTSYFSKDALQFFERNKWELEYSDFDGIMNWISLYKKMKNNA